MSPFDIYLLDRGYKKTPATASGFDGPGAFFIPASETPVFLIHGSVIISTCYSVVNIY
jgi:hypothetical protein